jgi:hypothetical protein
VDSCRDKVEQNHRDQVPEFVECLMGYLLCFFRKLLIIQIKCDVVEHSVCFLAVKIFAVNNLVEFHSEPRRHITLFNESKF